MPEKRTDQEHQPQSSREVAKPRSNEVRRRSASDYPTSPFEMMRRLTEQMFGPVVPRGLAETWTPSVEVFERDNKLVVRADLPGMSKDDVRAEIRDNTLLIEGERRDERKEDREGYFVTERVYGSFRRVIPLPQGVNAENAHATFRDGVLEIEMDAPKQKNGRSIPIDEPRQTQSSQSSSQSRTSSPSAQSTR